MLQHTLRRSFLLAATLLMLGSWPALAHEGHHHNTMGTIQALSATQIELKTKEGKVETYQLTDATTYKRGDAAAARADLKAGERAVVMYETKDGKNLAVEVKLPAATPQGHEGHAEHAEHAKPAAEPAKAEGPAAVVDAFLAALKGGDRTAALAYLAPTVVIFEQGGAEMSREVYASHHLEADMRFLAGATTKIVERKTGGDEHAAWVLTRSETTSERDGKSLTTQGTETMVLERQANGWKVVHIHWSSGKKG